MKRFLIAFGLLAVVAAANFAQHAERLKTVASAGASAGRSGKVMERTVALNMVNVVVRHCQRYNFARTAADQLACARDESTMFYAHTDHNLRTTAGGDWQASVMGNTSTPPATCNYIAVTNDGTAPAVGDTTLASEITTNGLARAIGVYAHTGGTASYTIQKVFSATGTQASQKTGLFNASSSGTMCFESSVYTSVTVNNGDTLTVTWTVNI